MSAKATTPRPLLRRGERGGATREVAMQRILATWAVLIAAVYVGGLLYLAGRGASKIASFTEYPMPLSGIEGEDLVRIVVGIGVFGGAAWVVQSVARWALTRRGAWTRAMQRYARIGVVVVGVGLSLLLRDRLPRFLVSMPSETTAGGGVGPEIFNTIYFAVLSTVITLPIGVGAAVYLARFARAPRFVASIRMALDTLASLPSIVYGLFGFLAFVVEMKAGFSLFAGAFVLALLNLPLVVGIAEESLRAVPRELEEASLALGATPVQTVARVTVPYAWPGILSALVLSVGRVFAESAPLIMTAGTTVSRANAYSLNPFRGGETLAVHLWYVNSAGLAPDKAEVSAGTAAVLVVLVALTNVIAARFARFGGAEGTRVKKATR